MHYTVITSGPLTDKALVNIKGTVICADGGADFLARNNVVPDIVYGDMDSISESGLAFLKDKGSKLRKFPVDKDYTDTELCLIDIPEGSDVTLICPLAGRIDHVLTNILVASRYFEKFNSFFMSDGIADVYYISGSSVKFSELYVDRFPAEPSKCAISAMILDYEEGIKGFTAEGLYYEADNLDVESGHSITASNKLKDGAAAFRMKITSGRAVVTVTEAV